MTDVISIDWNDVAIRASWCLHVDGRHVLIAGTAALPDRREVRIDARLGIPAPKRDEKKTKRLAAVARYHELRDADPVSSNRDVAERAGHEFGVCGQSILNWVRRVAEDGPNSLANQYAVPKFDPRDEVIRGRALVVCAWWAYRIANLPRIDGLDVRLVGEKLAGGIKASDLVSTIDFYYQFDSDRARFPYKSLRRWITYDAAKWMHRAAAGADQYRARVAAKERQRAAADPVVRRRVRQLAVEEGAAKPPSDAPPPDADQRVRAGRMLQRLGFAEAGEQVAATALGAADRPPQTIAEALHKMPDNYRSILLAAVSGEESDRDAAAATLPLWWDHLPETDRRNLDHRAEQWFREHPRSLGQLSPENQAILIQRRKLLMLLPSLRAGRSGIERLGVALRLPA